MATNILFSIVRYIVKNGIEEICEMCDEKCDGRGDLCFIFKFMIISVED